LSDDLPRSVIPSFDLPELISDITTEHRLTTHTHSTYK